MTRDTSVSKAFRVRDEDGKFATLNGEYVHFVVGRGKLCLGEEALFSFLGEVEQHCLLFQIPFGSLTVEEYDLVLKSNGSVKPWDKKATAFWEEKDRKRKAKEARADAAFEKKYALAVTPKLKTLKEIEDGLKRPTRIRVI